MFTEIALTPHVFDEVSNPDRDKWLEGIRELGHGISPRTASGPIIVVDLYDGGCSAEMVESIKRISDHTVRDKAQSILKLIKDRYAVLRPVEGDWPDDESGWKCECLISHAKEPLGKILISHSLYSTHTGCDPVFSIHHPADEHSGFWNNIQSHGNIDMDVDIQVRVLRPICIHADYIAIKSPYINGGTDDETTFAAKLIKSALNRPSNYPKIKFVELHLDGKQITDSKIFTRIASNISTEIINVIKSKADLEVRFHFWPHFTDREIVAGFFNNGNKYPRWGISMNHIARPNETQQSTTWSIIAQKNLEDLNLDTESEHIIDKYNKITV
ncbi:hypothetical protein ACFL3Q_03935 [Planctomycetota bacterium]